MQQNGAIGVSGQQNGGTVNVSFAQSYSDSATSSINASGASGTGGKIDIYGGDTADLDASGYYVADSEASDGGDPNFAPSGTASVINVTITTGGDAFAGNGDITVSSAITATGSGSLTLSAYRNITISAAITL